MFRRALIAVAAAGLLANAACSPIVTYSGFQAIDADPRKDVKVSVDTKSTVRGKLGSPSATSTFDPNVWFYINQEKERVAFRRPQVIGRNVTAISFDKQSEVVMSVDNYTLKDGRVIAYDKHETPTRGRELTVLEQILGTIGRGGMLPNDAADSGVPGSRPGDRPH
jgi:outer membrane protein assembly factor BamE (lipoprotein component of BamABCDE complex)